MVQGYRSLVRRTAAATTALTVALTLAGCPARESRPSIDTRSEVQPVVITPTPPAAPAPALPPSRPQQPPRENHLSPATRALVAQARTLSGHGDLDGASSTLDRALRIEPNNPLLWVERGRLRMTENDAHQAESCGRKALALASGDPATQKLAGQLLIDALRAQHRNPEAHEVETRPYMH